MFAISIVDDCDVPSYCTCRSVLRICAEFDFWGLRSNFLHVLLITIVLYTSHFHFIYPNICLITLPVIGSASLLFTLPTHELTAQVYSSNVRTIMIIGSSILCQTDSPRISNHRELLTLLPSFRCICCRREGGRTQSPREDNALRQSWDLRTKYRAVIVQYFRLP
jgi:hypothetical protein